jgi:hypothetical protein
VIKISDGYLESEPRYNYTTPKSYLELSSLFKSMIDDTRNSIINEAQHFLSVFHCFKKVQMNEDKITVKELEVDLLARLSRPGANLIENIKLMDALDRSKKVSAELNGRIKKAVETGAEINVHREAYRRVTTRIALLYFIFVSLSKIDHMCQFSLSAFVTVFKAMDLAEQANNPVSRKNNLVDSIIFMIF